MTKNQFLRWLMANYNMWGGSDERSLEAWLYSLGDFAKLYARMEWEREIQAQEAARGRAN